MIRVLVTSMDQHMRPFCTARTASLAVLCPRDKTVLAKTSFENSFEWDQELQVPAEAWNEGCYVKISDGKAPPHLREGVFEGRIDPKMAHQRVCGVMIVLLSGATDGSQCHDKKEAFLRLRCHALHRRYRQCNRQNERDLNRSAECIRNLTDELQRCTAELDECNQKLKRLTNSKVLLFGKYVLW